MWTDRHDEAISRFFFSILETLLENKMCYNNWWECIYVLCCTKVSFRRSLWNIFRWVKVKVKFSLEQATKVQTGSTGVALLFLQPRRYLGGGQIHAQAALPQGMFRYSLYRRLRGWDTRNTVSMRSHAENGCGYWHACSSISPKCQWHE